MDCFRSTLPLRAALVPALGAVLACGLLGGCVGTTASMPPPATEPHHGIARRDGVNPGAASVAVASLSGVPQPLADRFVAALKREAQEQDVTFTDPAKAKYLLRGYLSTYTTPQGTQEVAFVWDAFNRQKNRAQRGDDSVAVKAAADDPWSAVDDAALTDIAAKSASDLAAFLSNTPEAMLAATHETPAAGAAAAAPTPPAEETIVPGTEPPPLRGTEGVGVAALR